MPDTNHEFNSIYTHGYLRIAACTPKVSLASPQSNLERTLELAKRASDVRAGLALFPELGLSGYSNEDLFFQDALLDAVEDALGRLVQASRELSAVILVGVPLRSEGKLFNCAVVIYQGQILGVVPKTYLPNYREFYEKRQFTSGEAAVSKTISLQDMMAPFGRDLLFEAVGYPDFTLHVEICEDLWAPAPPSTYAALAGATVLTNLSASNITISKADFRRLLCASQSGRWLAAYAFTAAGFGESNTDLAWGPCHDL